MAGRGGDVDLPRAFSLNLSAAEHSIPMAMFATAGQYQRGEGTQQNPQLALYWYEKAADAGMDVAITNAAYMYLQGAGVESNRTRAIELFKKGADLGDPECRRLYTELTSSKESTISS